MIKQFILAPVIALSLSAVQPVFADQHKDYQDKGICHCKQMAKMADKLDLTKDQKAKIKAIKETGIKTMKTDSDELRQIRKEMKNLVKSDKMDEAKLEKLIDRKKAIIASMWKEKTMLTHQMYQVLDAKQKEKFSKLMDKWEEKKMKKIRAMDDE